MPIRTNCPECQSAYNLNEALAGKKVRCKSCGHTFLVTLAAEEALPAVLRVTPTPGAPAQGAPDAPDLAAPAAAKNTAALARVTVNATNADRGDVDYEDRIGLQESRKKYLLVWER